MMRAILILALVTLAACDARGSDCGNVAQPPVEYDRMPGRAVTIREAPYFDVNTQCHALGGLPVNENVEACARGGALPIIIVPEIGQGVSMATQACLMHHEFGHINGWPGDHPGARLTGANG